MAAITITNQDDTILLAVAAALSGATVGGNNLFAQVRHAGSPEEARQKYLTAGASATAVVVYTGTDEYRIFDLKWGMVCDIDLILAVKDTSPALRKTAITRLINGAKNAVAAGPPAIAKAFGADGELHRRLEWADPSLDLLTNQPWAIAVLPLRIAYVVDDETSR